uniref:Uncharacterized protein n=1 Tax=Anguilla anguilla TaxID=7936 RepID=A0A0E9SI81_ANGAN
MGSNSGFNQHLTLTYRNKCRFNRIVCWVLNLNYSI